MGLSLAGQAAAGTGEQGRDNYTTNNHRAPVGRRCRSGGLHSEPPPHLPGHWGAGRSQGFTASHLLLRMHTETEVPFWAPPVVYAEAEGSMRNVGWGGREGLREHVENIVWGTTTLWWFWSLPPQV